MKLFSLFLLAVTIVIPVVNAQSGGFEIPVQLLGFPVIIIAVRIANFLKKLSYALSPSTYRSRPRRGTGLSDVSLDPAEVEKRLILEMGPKVCIYEDVCIRHANPAMRSEQIDWEQLFKNYGRWPKNNGDYYLLSVFMGDIVGSATLCRQLAKRGRSCYNTRTPPAMPTLYEQSAMSSPVLPALYQLTPPTSSSAVNSYPPYSTAYYATGQYLSTS